MLWFGGGGYGTRHFLHRGFIGYGTIYMTQGAAGVELFAHFGTLGAPRGS
jgi:hypothetical protein